MSTDRAYELATKIVDDIMRNGAGEKADRLVLMLDDSTRPGDLGGWSRQPLIDRIAKVILQKPGRMTG